MLTAWNIWATGSCYWDQAWPGRWEVREYGKKADACQWLAWISDTHWIRIFLRGVCDSRIVWNSGWPMTSIEEEMKHDFLDQENDFFDTTSHTTGSFYVACQWPQLPLSCKISFD